MLSAKDNESLVDFLVTLWEDRGKLNKRGNYEEATTKSRYLTKNY